MKLSKSNKLNFLPDCQSRKNVLPGSNMIQAERLEQYEHTHQTTTRVSRTKVLETPLLRQSLLFPILIAGIVSCSSQKSEENERASTSPIIQANASDTQISELTARITQLEQSHQSASTQVTNLNTNVQNIYENKARVHFQYVGRSAFTGYENPDVEYILQPGDHTDFLVDDTNRAIILTGSLMLRTQSIIAADFYAVSRRSDGSEARRLLYRMAHQVAPGTDPDGHSSIRLPFFAFLNGGEFLRVSADYAEENSYNRLVVSNVWRTKMENIFVP